VKEQKSKGAKEKGRQQYKWDSIPTDQHIGEKTPEIEEGRSWAMIDEKEKDKGAIVFPRKLGLFYIFNLSLSSNHLLKYQISPINCGVSRHLVRFLSTFIG
jgi:uncharacterized protein (UPF0262 family)